MKRKYPGLLAVVLMFWGAAGWADSYTDTTALFRNAGQSGSFFHNSYGYAVLPTVGKGGFVVGRYYKGFAIFTIVKGGAMYQAAVAGQKFSYTDRA
jgi:hypothetical protein